MISGTQRAWSATAGALALVGAAIIAWGIAASLPGFAGFTPRLHFISLLAHPANVDGDRLNDGFVYGGGLVGLGLLIGAVRARGLHRWTTAWGAAAGFALALVGRYPYMEEVPHLVFAGATGVCATVATALAARTWRLRAAVAPSRIARTLAIGFRIAFAIQLACVLVAVVYFAVVVARLDAESVAALMRALPGGMRMSIGSPATVINPLAVLEWVYFGAALSALAGKGIAELARARATSSER